MSFQRCVRCNQQYALEQVVYYCGCGGLIEICHTHIDLTPSKHLSGVWRFKKSVLNVEDSEIISHPECFTRLYERDFLTKLAGVDKLYFKHEGENPTGSFKDRGMTVAVTQAKRLGQKILACASTGNTSASLAAYGAQAGLKTRVFLPEGKVAASK